MLILANYLQIKDISNNYKGIWDILFSLLFTNFAESKKGEYMEKENYNQIVFTAVRDNLAAIFNIRKFLPSEKTLI